jgi:hypothetical protein
MADKNWGDINIVQHAKSIGRALQGANLEDAMRAAILYAVLVLEEMRNSDSAQWAIERIVEAKREIDTVER